MIVKPDAIAKAPETHVGAMLDHLTTSSKSGSAFDSFVPNVPPLSAKTCGKPPFFATEEPERDSVSRRPTCSPVLTDYISSQPHQKQRENSSLRPREPRDWNSALSDRVRVQPISTPPPPALNPGQAGDVV